MSATDIRAAGGLVWRTHPDGRVEVAVVHRLRYDDWSLPKGKLDGREVPLLAAVREVGEETGRTVAVGRHLETVRYDVGDRRKAVQYWAMRDTGPLGDGAVQDTDEVDRVEWVAQDDVHGLLTYDDDRRVLASFARSAPTTAVVVLVRHARAGRRAQWDGEDRLRPLDPRGQVQADGLAELLECFVPTSVHAADRVRCEQTVEPLAKRCGLVLASLPAVSDEAWERDPAATVAAVDALAARGGVAVISSQGQTIPGLLDEWLPPRVRSTVRSTVTRKGAYWVIGTQAGVPMWVDRYDRPV